MIPSIRNGSAGRAPSTRKHVRESVSLATGGNEAPVEARAPEQSRAAGRIRVRRLGWAQWSVASCTAGPAGIAFQWVYSEKLGET